MDGNAQVLIGDTSRRFKAGGRRSESNPRLPHRDTSEGSNAQRAAAGAGDLSPQDVELILARFDLLEFRLDSMERRVDKLEAIDRRVTKLQASKAAYRHYSSNYDIAPYQQPTRFRPRHEQPPGWPPPQRSPPSCWPAQRRRHASERQQQTHAYRQQHEPVVAHMEPLNRFSNSPAATTQSRSCHEQPTVVLQPLLSPTSLQRSPIPPMASAVVPPPSSHLPSTRLTTQLVSCEEMHLGVEGDSQVLNQGDLQLNGMKLVDEELCYETELIIPIHHSSSLDQELDAHHKTEENSSLNWMCSFLDEVDESKSSLLNDNHDKATCDNDEFTEMECHSVKISDESDLQGDSSQQMYLDSDDDYEDDRVDGEGRRSHNITTAELPWLKVLVQRFMEDKQFGGRRTDADVGSRCMIRSLLQVPAIKDDFVKTKAREDRDGVEMMVILFQVAFDPGGDVSMLVLSSTLLVGPWFPP